MAIQIDEKRKCFTLHTKKTSYQMQADRYGVLRHLYYGPKVVGEASYLYMEADRGFSMQMADAAEERYYSQDALPLEYPAFGAGDFRSPAFLVRDEEGQYGCDLRFRSYELKDGKYILDGLPHTHGDGETLVITLSDAAGGVDVELCYGIFEEIDIITRAVRVVNRGEKPVVLEKVLSASLDFLYGRYELTSFYGRHAMERNLQKQAVRHGAYTIGSRRGSSSHQYNPFTVLAEEGTTETSGICYAMELVWSGGFTMLAEKDQFNGTRWQGGLGEEGFSWPLAPGEQFEAPEVILSCSGEGLELLTMHLHDCARNHLIRGSRKERVRPVLLNSWEACYCSFDGEQILGLADEAKELDLDMLVLDDGWFGKRDDDNSGLGDWFANEEKLGMSLAELIRRIHGKGLLFGIWIEPEMVSEDSELYRAHPEYVLQLPGRAPVHGRNQLVLNFADPAVVDCVFEQIEGAFAEEAPDYVKWDFNRSLYEAPAGTFGGAGQTFYKYMLGVYALLERFREKWPDMLIEGCAGGGGRFDAGMLYYTPQIWCSDNTDAVDRLRIQYGTSFAYPLSAIGAHVSVSPNEQNGRMTPLATRAAAAMAGTYGYELDPAKLSAEEKAEVRLHTERFRSHAELIMQGDYLRLTDPYGDHVAAWEVAAKDGSEVLVTAVTLEIHGNAPQDYIRLRRLTPGAVYRLVSGEETAEDAGISAAGEELYTAELLMYAGLPVPREMTEYAARIWHFVRV